MGNWCPPFSSSRSSSDTPPCSPDCKNCVGRKLAYLPCKLIAEEIPRVSQRGICTIIAALHSSMSPINPGGPGGYTRVFVPRMSHCATYAMQGVDTAENVMMPKVVEALLGTRFCGRSFSTTPLVGKPSRETHLPLMHLTTWILHTSEVSLTVIRGVMHARTHITYLKKTFLPLNTPAHHLHLSVAGPDRKQSGQSLVLFQIQFKIMHAIGTAPHCVVYRNKSSTAWSEGGRLGAGGALWVKVMG